MSKERLVGFLSYKDKFDRYHVTTLSNHNNEKWLQTKDHFDVHRITTKYKNKLQYKIADISNHDYTICTPWEKDGFYFSVDKSKIISEKIYDDKSFESCSVDDLLGYPILINTKISLYKTPKFMKVGCKIQALHIKNLEPIVKNNNNKLLTLY
jgi:hypothetical protein